MSWLFGIRKDSSGPPSDNFQLPVSPEAIGLAGNSSGSNDDKKKASATSGIFDSAALERGAAAAKELERSRKFLFLSR